MMREQGNNALRLQIIKLFSRLTFENSFDTKRFTSVLLNGGAEMMAAAIALHMGVPTLFQRSRRLSDVVLTRNEIGHKIDDSVWFPVTHSLSSMKREPQC